MSVEVTVRHLDLSEKLQEYAKEKAAKITGDFPAVEFVKIVLDQDGPFYTVSVSVQGGQSTSVESFDKGSDMINVINSAFEKAETQLRRNSQKRQDVRS